MTKPGSFAMEEPGSFTTTKRRSFKLTGSRNLLASVFGVCLLGAGCLAAAQTEKVADHPAAPKADPSDRANTTVRTFYLKHASQPNDGNEVLTSIRLMASPRMKIYLVTGQAAIMVDGTPEELALVQHIIDDIDRPRKSYRLTYTITESDAGKRLGVQHFALYPMDQQRTTLKTGSKVPILTGTTEAGKLGQTSQVTYLDLGMNFDATPVGSENGITLKSKVEQSSVAEHTPMAGFDEPLIRQSVVEGVYLLALGKPQMLGSMDIPGSTRHIEVEVLAELIR